MENEQELLEEKKSEIEERLYELASSTDKYVSSQEDKLAKIDEEIEEYADCANEIQNAIDYISMYAEED